MEHERAASASDDLVAGRSSSTAAACWLRSATGADLNAEHELELMIADAEGGELSPAHLHTAPDALQGHSDGDASQNLESASGKERPTLEELLDDLEADLAHDVQHELQRLLGEEPHGL